MRGRRRRRRRPAGGQNDWDEGGARSRDYGRKYTEMEIVGREVQ